MGVRRLLNPHMLAPIEEAGADQRHFYDGMKVEAADKNGRGDIRVASLEAPDARVRAEIQGKVRYRLGRKRHFQSWKLAQDHGGLVAKEDGVTRIQKIYACVGSIAGREGERVLQRRRDNIQPVFVDLTKHKRADKVHVSDAAKSLPDVAEGENAGALPALAFTIL